jgi:hypothetical protein
MKKLSHKSQDPMPSAQPLTGHSARDMALPTDPTCPIVPCTSKSEVGGIENGVSYDMVIGLECKTIQTHGYITIPCFALPGAGLGTFPCQNHSIFRSSS